MSALGKDAILALAATPPARELVTVEHEGQTLAFLCRGLTASEKNDLDAEQLRIEVIKGVATPRIRNERMTAKWLQRGLINEDGSLTFEPGDVKELGRLPNAVAEQVAAVIQRLTGGDRGVDLEDLSRATSGGDQES